MHNTTTMVHSLLLLALKYSRVFLPACLLWLIQRLDNFDRYTVEKLQLMATMRCVILLDLKPFRFCRFI